MRSEGAFPVFPGACEEVCDSYLGMPPPPPQHVPSIEDQVHIV